MLPPKPQHLFTSLFPQKLNGKNDETENKDQQADTINAMHVFYKIALRPVRIRFPDIKIFGYLFPDAH